MAAVLVVLAGIYFFFIHGLPTRVETSVGENRELFLPDSSRVVLNASSLLTYQEPHWDRKREVKLTGEAFFNVAHGSAFDVITEAGSIKVLGTQFNVKIRSDYFEVTCYEGLVSVEEGGKTTALSHHQMYRVINGENFRFSDVQDSSPGWINMESSFRSVPFIQVIREFERQYDVAIQTKQVDLDRLFTGRFINSDIELAINSITIPMNLSYQIIDDQNIVLSPDHN
jgi:ferric-dicitrate binding protein FerR (iron transport regulator)